MAKAKGEVRLGEYILKFSTNALAELEEQLQQPIGVLIPRMVSGKVGIKELRAFFWASLLYQTPNITLAQAGDIIDEVGMGEASKALIEAVSLAFPNRQGDKKGANPQNPIQNQSFGTGKDSAVTQ